MAKIFQFMAPAPAVARPALHAAREASNDEGRALVCCQIVMLFFLMLTERRVILMSAHPSVLSDCAHALNSLLYPFQWEHIYVPILVPKVRQSTLLLYDV